MMIGLRSNPSSGRTCVLLGPGEKLACDGGITLGVPHTVRLKKQWKCLCGSPDGTGTLPKPKKQRPAPYP